MPQHRTRMKIFFFLSLLLPLFFPNGTDGREPGQGSQGRGPGRLGGDALPGQVAPDPVGARRVDGCGRGGVQGEGAAAGA